MLVGGIVVVAVLLALVALQLSRRRTHDDVHSVEGYHRKLHTLEEITVHPVDSGSGEGPALAESALRVGSSRTVRLTDGSLPPPPPVPPPLVADPDQPVRFDDAQGGLVLGAGIDSRTVNDGHGGGLAGRPDRAMSAMNRRPRRLGAPIAAVAAVAVLIVVLLLAGIHKTPDKSHHHVTSATHKGTGSPGSGKSGSGKSGTGKSKGSATTTTSTTAAALVSQPQSATAHSATYMVGASSYSVVLSATGACWLYATNTSTGAVLYTGELGAGQSETVQAPGPISVEVGAPEAFSATLNGQAVTLPVGFQAPFTMHFVPSA
jgi:hypothetical protein